MDRRTFIAACGTLLAGIAANDVGPVGAVLVEDTWMVQVQVFSMGIVLLKSKQPLVVGQFVTSDSNGYVQSWNDASKLVIGVVVGMKEKL